MPRVAALDLDHTTIPALTRWAVEQYPDDIALVETVGATRRETTYAELGVQAAEAAAALVGLGVRPGEAVAIWAPNSRHWEVAALAAAAAGTRIVMVNTRYRSAEAADVVRRSHARVVFTVDRFLASDFPAMLRSEGDLPELRHVVLLGGGVAEGCLAWDELLAQARPRDAAEVERRSAAATPDDVSVILFTSGTTGVPKGAMIRGSALIRAFRHYCEYLGIHRGDRVLALNPFFHTFGFGGAILAGLMTGATMFPQAVWDVDRALDWIEDERITVLPAPPAIFQALIAHPDLKRRDVSSLRSTVTGADVIPDGLVEAMKTELGFETIITGYGLTESSAICSLCRPGDAPSLVAATDGRVLPDVEVKVVDDDGVEVARGTPGEILIRGYVVMAGYLDDPQATAETITSDGWLRTGDIGILDEHDYVTITGRKKDMYIVGGFNVYPAEVERLLSRHPAVERAAVVGVPDERLSEVGAAFVVPAAGHELDPDQLIAWVRRRIANYKVPRHVWVIDALPVTPTNKVQRVELAAAARERLAGVST